MLSKEVLSEVLGVKVTKIWLDEAIPNMLYYATDKSPVHRINIYELAFKCKEWAIHKEFLIESSLESVLDNGFAYAIVRVFFDGDMVFNNYDGKEFVGQWHTETEAIFKATEWVYKNTRSK